MQEGVVRPAARGAALRLEPGAPFWAYAVWWVSQAMQQLVAEVSRPIVLSDRALRELATVRRAGGAYSQKHGRDASTAELSRATGICRNHVESLLAIDRPSRGLEEPLRAEEGTTATLVDVIEDPRSADELDRVLERFETQRLAELASRLGETRARDRRRPLRARAPGADAARDRQPARAERRAGAPDRGARVREATSHGGLTRCASNSTRDRPRYPRTSSALRFAGGAGAELLELRSADGTAFSAAFAESPVGEESGVVILPDVRGLYPFYIELAERFRGGRPSRDRDRLLRPHRWARPTRRGLRVHAARDADDGRRHPGGHGGGAHRHARANRALGGGVRRLLPRRDALAARRDRARPRPRRSRRLLRPARRHPASASKQGRCSASPRSTCPCSASSAATTRRSPSRRCAEFDERLSELGVEHEIEIYEGAPALVLRQALRRVRGRV